jgi:hypothetical protein
MKFMVQIHYRFQDEIKNSFKNNSGRGFGNVSRLFKDDFRNFSDTDLVTGFKNVFKNDSK